MPTTEAISKGKKAKKQKSIRISIKEAAELCDLHYITFWKITNTGVFTTLTARDKKRGRGVAVKLLRDEVKVFARHGYEALRQFRAAKRAKTIERRKGSR